MSTISQRADMNASGIGRVGTHFIRSSTPKSIRHCSQSRNMVFAAATSNLRARKNLRKGARNS